MKKDLVFYIEGETGIIDGALNTTGRGHYSKETIEEVQAHYPGAELVPFDYAMERIDEALKEKYPMLEPKEITEDQWFDMLECLPPMQYKSTDCGISFKMSEMTCGDITQGYIKKAGKFYVMNCRVKTPHEAMLAVIK